MEYGLLLIFWYGILHAFGPDHLTAIADFSIGKEQKKSMMITVLYALGHGVTLFVFAKLLEHYRITDRILGYGNMISAAVIFAMGCYLLYLVAEDRIQLKYHRHGDKEHLHIWFGKEHEHDRRDTLSAFGVGALMGIGGVRGMLVVLGAVEGQKIDLWVIFAFTMGVMLVFVLFGLMILVVNRSLLGSKRNLRRVFSTLGVVSVLIGGNMLMAKDPLFHGHTHPFNSDLSSNAGSSGTKQQTGGQTQADLLLAGKKSSNLTYRQIMQRMGEAYRMMQSGVVHENRALVETGVWMIEGHPKPKEKPWSIVRDEDREAFKQTLIAYDRLLHQSASEVRDSLESGDWSEVNGKVHGLSRHCVSCHSVWKNNLKQGE